jgi:hypothetical protein
MIRLQLPQAVRQVIAVAGQPFRTGEVGHLDCNGFRITRVFGGAGAAAGAMTHNVIENPAGRWYW